jgi:hypothetical protein
LSFWMVGHLPSPGNSVPLLGLARPSEDVSDEASERIGLFAPSLTFAMTPTSTLSRVEIGAAWPSRSSLHRVPEK